MGKNGTFREKNIWKRLNGVMLQSMYVLKIESICMIQMETLYMFIWLHQPGEIFLPIFLGILGTDFFSMMNEENTEQEVERISTTYSMVRS
jgi:hypothetical protein